MGTRDELSGPAAGRLRVFLAEDDRAMREMIASALRRDGHRVFESVNGAGLLLDLARAFYEDGPRPPPSAIVSDLKMPARDGLAILRSLRHDRRRPPFILITAFGDPGVHAEARRLGAYAVFDKPFELATLRATLEEISRQTARPTGTAA